MNRNSKDYQAVRRAWLAWQLANGETFEERSFAGRRLRCVKAGRESARRQDALGWPNLARAWAANRRKGEATQALKRWAERTRQIEQRRKILANCARETQVVLFPRALHG
jgi:hypothetical protein